MPLQIYRIRKIQLLFTKSDIYHYNFLKLEPCHSVASPSSSYHEDAHGAATAAASSARRSRRFYFSLAAQPPPTPPSAPPSCASQPHRLFFFLRTVQPPPSPPSTTATVVVPTLAMEWHEALGGTGSASPPLPRRSRRSGLAGLKMARAASTASRWRASAEQGSGEDDYGGSVVPDAGFLGGGRGRRACPWWRRC